MDRALYDPRSGYYAKGKVRFGNPRGFRTFPGCLSPYFGQMLAEAARGILEALIEQEKAPADAPLTILELGAGDGDLAADFLDWIVAHRREERWRRIANRIRYAICEISPALRARQEKRLAEHTPSGRAVVFHGDARRLNWEGPFYGVVIANEVLTSLPCELIDVVSATDLRRVHVEPVGPSPGTTFRELRVPLAEGWWDRDGNAGPVPGELLQYFSRILPLVQDLDALGLLPTRLCWPAGVMEFLSGLQRLLVGPARCGAALFIDYGGTARHALDPRAYQPHVRVYGNLDGNARTHNPLERPGDHDITYDLDVSAFGFLAKQHGMAFPFFGHQSALERRSSGLDTRDTLQILMGRHRERGLSRPEDQLLTAHGDICRFRRACFWLMCLSAPEFDFPNHVFGEGLPWRGPEADLTLRPGVAAQTLRSTLEKEAAYWRKIEHRLKPGGDVSFDLTGASLDPPDRSRVLSVLRRSGFLAGAGEIRASG